MLSGELERVGLPMRESERVGESTVAPGVVRVPEEASCTCTSLAVSSAGVEEPGAVWVAVSTVGDDKPATHIKTVIHNVCNPRQDSYTQCLQPTSRQLYIMSATHIKTVIHNVCNLCQDSYTQCLQPTSRQLYIMSATHIKTVIHNVCNPHQDSYT